MQSRNLGTQGLVSSALGLGTMGMTMAYGAGDEAGGIATIRRAHELGVTMIDTAELSGGGTGSNDPERLAENVAAAEVELSAADLQRIEEVIPDGAFGSRYPEAMMPQW